MSGFQNLQQVLITGGKEFIPDIAETINDYTACSFGLKLDPEPLTIMYDDRLDVILISTTPTGRKTFADLGFIKFLNKKTERNVCDPTEFQLKIDNEVKVNNTHTKMFNIVPAID